MHPIQHLSAFFDKAANDNTLNPTHIALYISLFQFWSLDNCRNPMSISREELMQVSKIGSRATYHKCLLVLQARGFIKYEPTYNPFKSSQVSLIDLGSQSENTSNCNI